MSGSPAAVFPSSCSWHQDYHKRGTSVKPALICTQVRPINLKVAIKKHELLLFSIEIFWQKKRERPFNFIASRTLKYSLRSTFRFQPLCGRQDSWHLCMLLLFTMLFSFQMCAASDPSIPSDRSYWHAPSHGPVQKGSAVQCQSANWQFYSHEESFSVPLRPNCGPILCNVAKFCCFSCKHFWIKLKRLQQNYTQYGFPFISCKQIQVFVCVHALLAYLCIHVGMFMCGCGCVMHGPVEKSDCFIPAL